MPDPACQSKSPRFETKVVRDGQPYDTVRSVGPVRGGLGYRWLVTPEGLNHIHLGEAGWTIWEAIHAPFLSNYQIIKIINNIDKAQITTLKFLFYITFFLSYFLYLYIHRQFLEDI